MNIVWLVGPGVGKTKAVLVKNAFLVHDGYLKLIKVALAAQGFQLRR